MSHPELECVYCRTRSVASAFTREHVLNQGFGRFRGALVLHREVCGACNQYFSRTLDIALTRESVEGLERYRWGVKSAEEVSRFRYGSVTLRASDGTEYSGARVELSPGSAESPLIAKLLPGAAIRNTTGDGYTHYTLAQVNAKEFLTGKTDWRKGVKLFGDEASIEHMKTILAAEGIVIAKWQPLVPPEKGSDEVAISHEFQVTEPMKRGLAKIAFNYLTYLLGASVVVKQVFDPVRRYIRTGEGDGSDFVYSAFELPFSTERADGQRPVVHWLSITSHNSHRNLLGVVMLFGFMTHHVMLAENYEGPWPELPRAHLYNIKKLLVREVQPVKPRWRHPNPSDT